MAPNATQTLNDLGFIRIDQPDQLVQMRIGGHRFTRGATLPQGGPACFKSGAEGPRNLKPTIDKVERDSCIGAWLKFLVLRTQLEASRATPRQEVYLL